MSVPRQQQRSVAALSRSVPPYCRGQRVRAVDPADGSRYLLRVERIVPRAAGEFTLVAAVVSPRRLRSHLVTVTVDADGCADALQMEDARPRSS